MKLYGFPASPNTWKVRALAAQLGLSLEFEFVDLTKGGSHTAHYLAINPTGRTPALTDGAFTLWESTAILQYLASRQPSSLWPNDDRVRADIMRWQSWELAHWTKEACEPLIFERLVKQILRIGPPEPSVVEKGLKAFHKEAAMLDNHLAGRSHLVEDTLTLADFSVAAPLFYAERADLPLAAYPNVNAWFDRVSALPCWHDTAPQPVAAAA